jgi:hypothetical protein
MAIAAWKRLEKTPGYQKKKRFLKRLIGKELKLRNDIEIPVIKDGGWWFDDIDFDLSVIEKYGVEVHAFDPTPNSIDMLDDRNLPRQFAFHPWAVSASDGSLKLYPHLRKDGTKSEVMYTMIAEEETIDDAIEVPD